MLLEHQRSKDLLKEGVPILLIGYINFMLMGFAWGCSLVGSRVRPGVDIR